MAHIRPDFTLDDAVAAGFSATAFPEPATFTLVGHWDSDTLVVEDIDPGQHEDTRPETGQWPEGLWSDSFAGISEAALAVAAWETYPEADQVRRALSNGDFTP